jgi:hypothetical protein
MYTSESMVEPAGGDHTFAPQRHPLHVHSTALSLHGRVWLMEFELPHHHTATIENTPRRSGAPGGAGHQPAADGIDLG